MNQKAVLHYFDIFFIKLSFQSFSVISHQMTAFVTLKYYLLLRIFSRLTTNFSTLNPHIKAASTFFETPPSGESGPGTARTVGHRTAHRIFLKFYMKLEGLNGQKLTKLNILEKFSFLGKYRKIPPELGLLAFLKNLIHCLTVHNSVLYNSAKFPCQEKVFFISYNLKSSKSIGLCYSLIINISGRNQAIS